MAGMEIPDKFDERAGFVVGPLPAVVRPDAVAPIQGRRGLVPAQTPAPPRRTPLRRLTAARARLVPAVRAALVTELERGTPFLFVPVFLAVGALAYFAADSEPAFATVIASVAVLAGLRWLARERLLLQLALSAALCLALGVLFAKVETWRAATKVLSGSKSTAQRAW